MRYQNKDTTYQVLVEMLYKLYKID